MLNCITHPIHKNLNVIKQQEQLNSYLSVLTDAYLVLNRRQCPKTCYLTVSGFSVEMCCGLHKAPLKVYQVFYKGGHMGIHSCCLFLDQLPRLLRHHLPLAGLCSLLGIDPNEAPKME